jgi:hypothetical protein
MNRNSGDARKLRGERQLLHHYGSMGEIFYQFRIAEPEI